MTPSAQKHQKKARITRRGKTSKPKPEDRPLAQLVVAIKNMKYILGILKLLGGFRLPSGPDNSIKRLVLFCNAQVDKVRAKQKTDDGQILRVISMAQSITDELYDKFEGFLSGTFDHQDNVMQVIRKTAPEVLEAKADEIFSLQTRLRDLLDPKSNATYEDLVVAYNEINQYLIALQSEVKQVVALQEQVMDEGFAEDLSKELEDIAA